MPPRKVRLRGMHTTKNYVGGSKRQVLSCCIDDACGAVVSGREDALNRIVTTLERCSSRPSRFDSSDSKNGKVEKW